MHRYWEPEEKSIKVVATGALVNCAERWILSRLRLRGFDGRLLQRRDVFDVFMLKEQLSFTQAPGSLALKNKSFLTRE